jgi:hypothetical protein
MADFYDEPERAWDEYDWERFLQQQDSKTERYMELFEKYIDDPNRDQIIAQEMGWTHLIDQPSHVAVASAKLAAALSDHETEEIGMTIAYLKRALRAISTAIEAATQMSHDGSLKVRQFEELYHRLFQVRDSIIVMMGDLRAEWRRRYGL